MTRFVTWALAAVALGVACAPAEADADVCGASGVLSGAGAFTCTYSTVGSDVFTVPAGVTTADFSVVGASGGHYFIDGDAAHPDPGGVLIGRPGGAGGETTATLADLTPGEVLQVDVAGRGGNGTAPNRSGGMANGPTGGAGAPGGFGGSGGDAAGAAGGSTVTPGGNGGNGSGGGGASDVRFAPGGCAATLACPLSAVLLVAAGGGGGGGGGGQGNAIGGAGGGGGGPAGSDGGATIDGGNAGVAGHGATPSAGGAGGLNPGLHASGAVTTDPRYGGDGAAGGSGAGGVGGAGNTPCTTDEMLTPPCTGGPMSGGGTSGGGAGGGGGGGLFGGGGGSGGGGLFGGYGGAGGGGGGGSSFAVAAAVNPVLTSGVNCDPTTSVPCSPTINGGNGQVTITWAAPGSIATTTTLATSPDSPVTNQTLTLTATVTPASGAADGTVEFDNHHVAIPACDAVPVDAGGTAVCSFVVTAAGSPYGLNAIFVPSPTTVQVGSTSASQRVVVGLDPTTTALTVSSPTVPAGGGVVFTATVAPVDAAALAPTGTVQFADGGTPIPACPSQPLSAAATATCAVTYADGGSHAITASYQADANFAASVSASVAVTALPPAPANTAVPTISGSPVVGGTLTEAHGAWTESPTSFAYAWQECDAAGGGCTAIAGASGQSYMPVAADVGHTIRVAESALNVTGTGGPAVSAATPVVPAPAGPAAPASVAPPVAAGAAAVGRVLTCSQGSWSGALPQTYAYQWLRDGTASAGRTGAAYTAVAADAGHAVACRVTATNAAGSAVATSVAVKIPAVGTAKAAAARVSGKGASLVVTCTGAVGGTCAVVVTLTVVETVKGGRVTAVAASRRKVTLGTKTVTLGAGRHATVAVKLNAAGRHLLAARHRLRVRLVAAAGASGGRTSALRTQTLTFKA